MGKREAEDDESAFPRGGEGGGDFPRGARSDRSHDREKTGKRRKTGGAFEDDSMPFGHARVPTASKEKHFVESLKHKTLRVGMKLLGVVTEVTERGMQVSLPNGLRGTVTRAEAADAFADERARDERRAEAKTAKKKKKKKKDEGNGDDDDSDDDASSDDASSDSFSDSDDSDRAFAGALGGDPPLSLTAAFFVGQIVRCAVRRLEKGKSGGKRIDLTTRVSSVVRGVAPEAHLRDGVNVPAEVTSAEDHGYVLSFGFTNAPPGFLPRKAAPQGRALCRGSTLDVVLTGADREEDAPSNGTSRFTIKKKTNATAKRVLTATADRKRVASAVTHESDFTSVSTLLPGMLVNARVKAVLKDGVSANFMTYFVGAVDAFHVGDDAAFAKNDERKSKKKVNGPAIDPAATHRVGERCRARVLFVDADAKRVGLSLRPHLIHYGAPRGHHEYDEQSAKNASEKSTRAPDAASVVLGPGNGLPPLGFVCAAATVRRVDKDIGALLELEDADGLKTLGYCHISDASDGHVEKLEKTFKVNARVRCRVVGRRAVDGISVVSARRSVVDQPFLSADELEPGMRVRGEVVALEPYGAMVRLAPGVKALCPPHHVSDVPGRVSSAKVKEGAISQFRVLSVDKLRRRVAVTHKKTLVRSELAVVATLADAKVGARCHGVVTGVEPYGVFVQLFGEARGLAGLQDLGLSADQAPEEAYQPGQCVRCVVLRADNLKKLRLSLVDTEASSGFPTPEISDDDALDAAAREAAREDDVPTIGTVFESAVVRSVDVESGLVRVASLDGRVSGAVTAAHVSDFPETGAAIVRALRIGDEIGPVVVLETKPNDKKSSRCVLSLKRSLVAFARRGALPASVADVAVGASYPGYVASVAGGGVFVRFLGRLTGLCPPSGFQTCFSKTAIEPSDRFALGQTVVARITAVDATASPPRLSLTLAGAGAGGREKTLAGKKKTGKNDASAAAAARLDAALLDPDAALVRSIFADAETLAALAEKRPSSGDDGVAMRLEAVRGTFAPGSKLSVVASATKPYGVLAEAAEDDDAVCLLANAQMPTNEGSKKPKPVKEGDALDVVVLDVDRREGVVDVGARSGLLASVAKKKKKKKKTEEGPALGAEVSAVIELVKPEYVVASLPEFGGTIAFCATRAFNAGFGPGVDEARRGETGEPTAPFGGMRVGETFAARVVGVDKNDDDENDDDANVFGSPGLTRVLLCADSASLGDSTFSGVGVGGADGDALGVRGTHAVGASFEASVREVQLAQLILDLPGGGRGRLHATEAECFSFSFAANEKQLAKDGSREKNRRGPVFGSVKRGDTMRVVVLGPAGDRGSMLELSARRAPAEAKALFAAAADAGAGDGGAFMSRQSDKKSVAGAALLSTREHGDAIPHGIVTAVSTETLTVSVAPGVTVRVPRIETASDAAALAAPLPTRFAAGEPCGALTVLTCDAARRRLTCTLRTLEDRQVKKGETMPAIVVKVGSAKDGGSVFAQLTGTRRGRAHACDLLGRDGRRGFTENPWFEFKPGRVVKTTVLGVSEDGGEIDLSFVSGSKTDDILTSLQPGSRVDGYVKNVTKSGVFVAIARDADARVKMCNLGDAFVEDPIAAFPRGALVRGVVVAVDTVARRVEMTMRSDGVDASNRDGGSNNANLARIEVGLVTMGTVRRVQTYGVFVTLDGSGRSGLCHISAFADARIKDGLEAHVRAGERVRVKVLEVDETSGRVSLGMKPSLFAEEDAERDAETDGAAGKKADVLLVDEEDEEDEDAEDDEDEEDEEDEDEEDEEDEDEDDDEDEDEEDDEGADEEAEDAEDDASDGSDDLVASDDSEEDEMDVDSEDDSEDADADADSADSDSEPMDDDGLDWDADDAKGKRDRGGDDEADAIANDLMDSKPLTKREKARKKAAKEMELHKKEQALKTRADAAPETASEFEKALMGNPRSSFLWIRYAAFHVSVGAHDEARAVAERALKAIPASDQDEKMNVWVMYLNLEHAHGKPNPRDAVAKLFARACAVANPKKLHLALAGTHERGGDFEAQTALLAAATRKFSQSAKVWIAHARAAILAKERQKNAQKKTNESVDPDAVKKALDRASQSLPKRKVVKVLVQVALVEIREGSRERGRSVFESVLRNYPRRTDIWSTYVDQEIKMFAESGDPERCRGLLERATHLELNPKAMKFLFKRYLDFERKVGDAKRVEHVKERAMQYVASKFG